MGKPRSGLFQSGCQLGPGLTGLFSGKPGSRLVHLANSVDLSSGPGPIDDKPSTAKCTSREPCEPLIYRKDSSYSSMFSYFRCPQGGLVHRHHQFTTGDQQKNEGWVEGVRYVHYASGVVKIQVSSGAPITLRLKATDDVEARVRAKLCERGFVPASSQIQPTSTVAGDADAGEASSNLLGGSDAPLQS